MFGARTLARHAHLVNEMSRRVGVDLAEVVAEGRISGEGLREAVVRCTGCERPEACAHWLAEHADGAATTPDYCRNTALFDALRKAGSQA